MDGHQIGPYNGPQRHPSTQARRQIKAGTRLASHTLDLLPRYGVPVLESRIGDPKAFRHAAAGGVTVADLPRAGKAAAEIATLADELLLVLNGDQP